MTQNEIDELMKLLEDPITQYSDTDDEELYPIVQKNSDRICELLDKIKPH